MRHLLAAAAVLGVLALTGCGYQMDEDTMRELAKARDLCVELGGTFEQWAADAGPGWRCDFEEGANHG